MSKADRGVPVLPVGLSSLYCAIQQIEPKVSPLRASIPNAFAPVALRAPLACSWGTVPAPRHWAAPGVLYRHGCAVAMDAPYGCFVSPRERGLLLKADLAFPVVSSPNQLFGATLALPARTSLQQSRQRPPGRAKPVSSPSAAGRASFALAVMPVALRKPRAVQGIG